jgi:hypothetical protein
MRKLRVDEIECRVAQVTAKGCSLLLYKTARVDRAILDEQFGSYWQNDFKVIDGNMYGGIGVYDKELKEWIWRWDCGTESNTEKEKGQASDCFKRAGFKWGIGVELYTAPFIWVSAKTEQNSNGKYVLADKGLKFDVKSIDYAKNGDINHLIIQDNQGNQVYKFGQEKKVEKMTFEDTPIYIELAKINDIDKVKEHYEQFKELVSDRLSFHKMVNDRIKALKAIAKEAKE